MQESGENLKLKYKKANYAPYAENLRHVLNRIEGHFIIGYADGGDEPLKQLNLIDGAYKRANQILETEIETNKNFQKVVDLIDGFESSFWLELLSTVHWIIKNENSNSTDDIIKKVYLWNSHKKKFSPRQIKIAIDVLSRKGWVNQPKSL